MKEIYETTTSKSNHLAHSIFLGYQLNNKNSIDDETKVGKITALTSGIVFPKENCNKEKPPNEKETINTTMRMLTKNEIETLDKFYIYIAPLTKVRCEKIKPHNIAKKNKIPRT
ncbi:hypothetical protein [Yersinia artesiana]|uniref:hypothetical protein n=1 Tax=Yersinia artesiana TaxID=2890315 RepID=UPI001D0FB124|nr:hypothetical protein [Yersinia artesiana]